jgi:hypothetical protein
MRVFKQYHPKMIAKHVKGLFCGRLYIDGRGGYVFNRGRLVMPIGADETHRQTVQEINRVIAGFEQQFC